MKFTAPTRPNHSPARDLPGPEQDDMTDGDGDMSPPVPLHAGNGLISGFSAAPGGGGDVGRSMKPGKELALAGGSSADTVGSPPPPSKSLKAREVEVEGGKKKRKRTELDASGVHRCSLCKKSFKSRNAVNGHMHVHKNRPWWRNRLPKQQVHEEQDEELASILVDLGQRKSNRKEGSETKGDGSTVAEGGASSSSALEAQRRKKIHMELDLNKEVPEDEDNDDEDYGDDNEGA